MSDWQVGDLALCIKRDEWRKRYTGLPVARAHPTYGEVCRVWHVQIEDGFVVLSLEGYSKDTSFNQSYGASRFRKIRPSAIKHIEALKRLPVKEPEDA